MKETTGIYEIGNTLRINFDANTLTNIETGEESTLKPQKNCDILFCLWRNRNHVVTYDLIYLYAWKEDNVVGNINNAVSKCISKIKEIIGKLCGKEFSDSLIENISGVGYKLIAPDGSWEDISGISNEKSLDKDNEPDELEDDINAKDCDFSDSSDEEVEHDSNNTTDEPSNVNIDIKDNTIVNMSHNVLVIGFLAEIVTLLFKKRSFRPSKKIFVISSIALLVIFTTALLCVRYNRYSDAITSAKNYLNEGKYAEAIELFKVAEHSAITISQRLDTKRSIGDCYLVTGISKDSTSDLTTATKYYDEILKQKFDRSNETYVDALAGKSLAYSFAKRPMNQQWTDMVKELSTASNKLDKIDTSADPKDIDSDNLQCWIKVWFAMWDFFYTAIQNDYSFMYDTEILKGALYYCENLSKYTEIAKKKNTEIAILLPQPDFESVSAELYVFIAKSPRTKDPTTYANKAIEICKSYLKNASGNDLSKPTYYSFKALMGEAYCTLGNFYSTSNPQKSSEYMEQAYTAFSSLLDFDGDSDELELTRIVNIGYNAIFTRKCTIGDIEKILDKYDELISEIMKNKDPKETARFALNIGDCCRGIIEIYGPNKRAFEMGKNMTEEAKTVEEYIQQSQLDSFEDMYDYFHNE